MQPFLYRCILTNYLNSKIIYSEQELVVLLQQRDEKAFSYLYDNYSGALYAIINSIVTVRETANDVLQNVFRRKLDYNLILLIKNNKKLSRLRSCYSEIYSKDELEEGEIDVRLQSFKGCFIERLGRSRN